MIERNSLNNQQERISNNSNNNNLKQQYSSNTINFDNNNSSNLSKSFISSQNANFNSNNKQNVIQNRKQKQKDKKKRLGQQILDYIFEKRKKFMKFQTGLKLWAITIKKARLVYDILKMEPEKRDQQHINHLKEKLKEYEFFDGKKQYLNKLAKQLKFSHTPKGKYVFKQNDIGKQVYIILSGTISVRKLNQETNKEEILKYFSHGSGFGDRALKSISNRRTASIFAESDCYFATIDQKSYNTILPIENILMDQKLQEFSQQGVFKFFENFELRLIFNKSDEINCNFKQIIYEQGDPSQYIYIVLKGSFQIQQDYFNSSQQKNQQEQQLYKKQSMQTNTKQNQNNGMITMELNSGFLFGEEEFLKSKEKEIMINEEELYIKLLQIQEKEEQKFFQQTDYQNKKQHKILTISEKLRKKNEYLNKIRQARQLKEEYIQLYGKQKKNNEENSDYDDSDNENLKKYNIQVRIQQMKNYQEKKKNQLKKKGDDILENYIKIDKENRIYRVVCTTQGGRLLKINQNIFEKYFLHVPSKLNFFLQHSQHKIDFLSQKVEKYENIILKTKLKDLLIEEKKTQKTLNLKQEEDIKKFTNYEDYSTYIQQWEKIQKLDKESKKCLLDKKDLLKLDKSIKAVEKSQKYTDLTRKIAFISDKNRQEIQFFQRKCIDKKIDMFQIDKVYKNASQLNLTGKIDLYNPQDYKTEYEKENQLQIKKNKNNPNIVNVKFNDDSEKITKQKSLSALQKKKNREKEEFQKFLSEIKEFAQYDEKMYDQENDKKNHISNSVSPEKIQKKQLNSKNNFSPNNNSFTKNQINLVDYYKKNNFTQFSQQSKNQQDQHINKSVQSQKLQDNSLKLQNIQQNSNQSLNNTSVKNQDIDNQEHSNMFQMMSSDNYGSNLQSNSNFDRSLDKNNENIEKNYRYQQLKELTETQHKLNANRVYLQFQIKQKQELQKFLKKQKEIEERNRVFEEPVSEILQILNENNKQYNQNYKKEIINSELPVQFRISDFNNDYYTKVKKEWKSVEKQINKKNIIDLNKTYQQNQFLKSQYDSNKNRQKRSLTMSSAITQCSDGKNDNEDEEILKKKYNKYNRYYQNNNSNFHYTQNQLAKPNICQQCKHTYQKLSQMQQNQQLQQQQYQQNVQQNCKHFGINNTQALNKRLNNQQIENFNLKKNNQIVFNRNYTKNISKKFRSKTNQILVQQQFQQTQYQTNKLNKTLDIDNNNKSYFNQNNITNNFSTINVNSSKNQNNSNFYTFSNNNNQNQTLNLDINQNTIYYEQNNNYNNSFSKSQNLNNSKIAQNYKTLINLGHTNKYQQSQDQVENMSQYKNQSPLLYKTIQNIRKNKLK